MLAVLACPGTLQGGARVLAFKRGRCFAGAELYWSAFKDCVVLRDMARFGTGRCQACSTEFHPRDAPCDYLPSLLQRMRFAACTRRDWEWVNHLTLDAIGERDPERRALFESDSTLYLVPRKSEAHEICASRFERLQRRTGRWGCGIRARDGTDAGRSAAGRPAAGDNVRSPSPAHSPPPPRSPAYRTAPSDRAVCALSCRSSLGFLPGRG